MNKLRYLLSIMFLFGLIAFSPGASPLVENSDVAFASSDPVIAAAGDIACDPANAAFNGGAGTSNACRQQSTSDLLVNAGYAAVLPLGDIQYYCGGYQAFIIRAGEGSRALHVRSWATTSTRPPRTMRPESAPIVTMITPMPPVTSITLALWRATPERAITIILSATGT